MPAKLEELLRNINVLDGGGHGQNKVTCVIANASMGCAMKVASKMRTKGAVFWPASVAIIVLELNIPRLVDVGLIDSDGKNYNTHIYTYLYIYTNTNKVET